MILSIDDFKSIIENPKNQGELNLAQFDNERMSFHAKRSTSLQDISEYFTTYKQEVNKILISSKQEPFWALWKYPLPTTQILSDAADEINKVFEAKDSVSELKCTDEDLTKDFEEYEDKNICEFFEYKVFNAIWENTNAWIIVDLPSEQKGSLPEPFPFIVTAKEVFDISVYKEVVEYIVLKKGETTYFIIDDLYYYQVNFADDLIGIQGIAKHDLGYCPVFPIWNDCINDKGIRKLSPIIDILEKLDYYPFKYVQKKFIDLYADSPILEKYESVCTDNNCVNGYLTGKDGEKTECKTCSSNRKFIGAGTVLGKPMPNGITNSVVQAANWITVPTDSLQYTKDTLKETESNIFEYLTGYVKGGDRTQSVNKDQVHSQLEARKSKLNWWSENLSKIHSKVSETVGRLRYGNKFAGVHIDYGSQFHLWTFNDALTEYELAVTNGLPMYLISLMRNNIADLITGNSNSLEQRVGILKQLEPYPDKKSIDLERGTVEYELKADFSNYIQQFELQNGDIVQFGSLIPFETKIQKIKDVLYSLASAKLQTQFESKTKYQIIAPILN